MARSSNGGIYVPQTGTVYPSISEASRALGVDSSNIGKVLRGARISAGGYSFVRVDAGASPELLQDIDEALHEQTTQKQRERMRKTRQKNEGRLSPAERARRKEKKAAAKELHDVLVGANRAIQELKKQGVAGYSYAVTELENLKSLIGRTKTGAFDTSIKNLMDLTIGEIRGAIAAAKAQAERLKKTEPDKLKKRRAAVAFQFGVSIQELEKYDDVLPILWDLLEIARAQQGIDYSRSLYNAFLRAVQYAEDPQVLQDILGKVRTEYQASIEDESGVDLDDILQEGAQEINDAFEHPEDILGDDWTEGWVDLPTDSDDEDE